MHLKKRRAPPVEATAGLGRLLWRALQTVAADLAIDDDQIRRLMRLEDDAFRVLLLRKLRTGHVGLAAAAIRWRLQ